MFPWVKTLAAAFPMLTVRRQGALLFVIPGGTAGFPAINTDLYRDHRAFRDSIEATGEVIEEMLGWTAAAAFRGEPEEPASVEIERRNDITRQGMTRIALIDQWRAEGIVPDGAVGVSLGEVITPYAVGAITREECARLVAVVAHSLVRAPLPFVVLLVTADGETTRHLCRTAPVIVDFLGTSNPQLSLVICSDGDLEVVRAHFGPIIVKEAPCSWRYHTPWMHWDRAWSREQLGGGISLRPTGRPIYSAATGGLLPTDSLFDAQLVQWQMSFPSYFANAVSAALADGFDTVVQISSRPMYVFADVVSTAEAEGRQVRQFMATDQEALAEVRRMRRKAVARRRWISATPLPAVSPRPTRNEVRDVELEQVAERLLQPLIDGVPLDVVAALADPLADARAADRDELRRAVAASVLHLLCDDSLRSRVTENPELVHDLAGRNEIAHAAVRTLLRVAPDFAAFQPLNTVQLVDEETLQLVIAR